MTPRYMLDTNIVSFLIRGRASVTARIRFTPTSSLCISAVTEAELEYGLAKHRVSDRTQRALIEFLSRTESMPWSSAEARAYGHLRAGLERKGLTLAAMDLQIAAHALSLGATLVTNDAAFAQIPGLATEDWTQPVQ